MVEQLICNQQVAGSSPVLGSNSKAQYGGIPKRPKGADCKSVVTDFDGSNPSSSTTKKTPLGRLFCCGGGCGERGLF